MSVTPPASTITSAHTLASLVTEAAGGAANTDARLLSAWGIAFNPTGFVWVANEGSSTSTLYDGNGVPQTLVVAIPAGIAGAARPTGIVFNGSQDFKVTQNGVTGASPFISSIPACPRTTRPSACRASASASMSPMPSAARTAPTGSAARGWA